MSREYDGREYEQRIHLLHSAVDSYLHDAQDRSKNARDRELLLPKLVETLCQHIDDLPAVFEYIELRLVKSHVDSAERHYLTALREKLVKSPKLCEVVMNKLRVRPDFLFLCYLSGVEKAPDRQVVLPRDRSGDERRTKEEIEEEEEKHRRKVLNHIGRSLLQSYLHAAPHQLEELAKHSNISQEAYAQEFDRILFLAAQIAEQYVFACYDLESREGVRANDETLDSAIHVEINAGVRHLYRLLCLYIGMTQSPMEGVLSTRVLIETIMSHGRGMEFLIKFRSATTNTILAQAYSDVLIRRAGARKVTMYEHDDTLLPILARLQAGISQFILRKVNHFVHVSQVVDRPTHLARQAMLSDSIQELNAMVAQNDLSDSSTTIVELAQGVLLIFLVAEQSTERTQRSRQALVDIAGYVQPSGETTHTRNPEKFVDALVNVLSIETPLEELTAEAEAARKLAAAGTSIISKRGDRVLFKEHDPHSSYIRSIGIRDVLLKQGDDGYECTINWFNTLCTFHIGWDHTLQISAEMTLSSRAWLENFLLTCIAGVRHYGVGSSTEKVSDDDGADAGGGGRKSKGKRAHLRVLAEGYRAKGVRADVRQPNFAPATEEETYKNTLVREYYGVSLWTLNQIFMSVQEDRSLLKITEEEFVLLYEMFESQVVDEETRTVGGWSKNAESVRQLVIELLARLSERQGYDPNVIYQTTFVTESAVGQDLGAEFDPMVFSLPFVSAQMQSLAGHDPLTNTAKS